MFKININNFFIKEGYKHRDSYHHYDDMEATDEWQESVYLKSKMEAVEKKFNTILDIGCGSGFKLRKHFKNNKTIGLELEQNVKQLKEKYPESVWEVSDFNKKIEEKVDLIICSDVIEHLVNPDELLNFIYNIDFKVCVMSTPDRDVIYGKDFKGPPKNSAHVREWNKEEFYNYIKDNFKILEHYLDKAQKTHTLKQTQIIVFEKKHKEKT